MNPAGSGLAYEEAPPLSAPLRFFLTAPLFGIAAGLILLLDGNALSSRWTPGTLAIVHLFAAGFMLQVMLGALLQILPVVAGASIPAPLRVARGTHVLLAGGAASLAWGLGTGVPLAITAGASLLVAGLALFLAACVIGLKQAPPTAAKSRTPRDLRLALTGLAVAAVFGLLLALTLGRGMTPPLALPTLVNLHAGWAWMGWGGLLLASTSWVVVPMFQITPAYPAAFTRLWAPAVLAALLLWSLAMAAEQSGPAIAVGAVLMTLAAGFAAQTLKLQSRSRRTTPDASFKAFRLAMLAVLGGLLALIASLVTDASPWPVLAGVLILHGGFGGTISAMLYKIVPFLAWLHLTHAGARPPNVKKLLPDAPVRAQLRLRMATLAALTTAVFVPAVGHLAGLLLLVEFAWLLANLLRVVRAWHQLGQARK